MIRTLKGDKDFYRPGAVGTVIKKHPVSGNLLVAFHSGEYKKTGNPWWVDPQFTEEAKP